MLVAGGSSLPCSVFHYHTGVAYTSECFPCKPGTFSNKPGSFNCQVCPRNTYSEKGAKECIKCEEHSQFSGRTRLCQFMLFVLLSLNLCLLRVYSHKPEVTHPMWWEECTRNQVLRAISTEWIKYDFFLPLCA